MLRRKPSIGSTKRVFEMTGFGFGLRLHIFFLPFPVSGWLDLSPVLFCFFVLFVYFCRKYINQSQSFKPEPEQGVPHPAL